MEPKISDLLTPDDREKIAHVEHRMGEILELAPGYRVDIHAYRHELSDGLRVAEVSINHYVDGRCTGGSACMDGDGPGADAVLFAAERALLWYEKEHKHTNVDLPECPKNDPPDLYCEALARLCVRLSGDENPKDTVGKRFWDRVKREYLEQM